MAEMYAHRAFGHQRVISKKAALGPLPPPEPPRVDQLRTRPVGWSGLEETINTGFTHTPEQMPSTHPMADLEVNLAWRIKRGRQLGLRAVQHEEAGNLGIAEKVYIEALSLLVPASRELDFGPNSNRNVRMSQKSKVQREAAAMLDRCEGIRVFLKRNTSGPPARKANVTGEYHKATASNTTSIQWGISFTHNKSVYKTSNTSNIRQTPQETLSGLDSDFAARTENSKATASASGIARMSAVQPRTISSSEPKSRSEKTSSAKKSTESSGYVSASTTSATSNVSHVVNDKTAKLDRATSPLDIVNNPTHRRAQPSPLTVQSAKPRLKQTEPPTSIPKDTNSNARISIDSLTDSVSSNDSTSLGRHLSSSAADANVHSTDCSNLKSLPREAFSSSSSADVYDTVATTTCLNSRPQELAGFSASNLEQSALSKTALPDEGITNRSANHSTTHSGDSTFQMPISNLAAPSQKEERFNTPQSHPEEPNVVGSGISNAAVQSSTKCISSEHVRSNNLYPVHHRHQRKVTVKEPSLNLTTTASVCSHSTVTADAVESTPATQSLSTVNQYQATPADPGATTSELTPAEQLNNTNNIHTNVFNPASKLSQFSTCDVSIKGVTVPPKLSSGFDQKGNPNMTTPSSVPRSSVQQAQIFKGIEEFVPPEDDLISDTGCDGDTVDSHNSDSDQIEVRCDMAEEAGRCFVCLNVADQRAPCGHEFCSTCAKKSMFVFRDCPVKNCNQVLSKFQRILD